MMGMDCVNQQAVSDRDCSHCIWHTDGRCASWDCEYISRKEALEALERVKKMATHSNTPNTLKALDCISRQDALNALLSVKKELDAYLDDYIKDFSYALRSLAKAERNRVEEDIEIITGLPSAQPERLTDKEQRIFLAAMGREEKVCEEVDRNHVREPYEDSLMYVCKEIKRKVKGALWT